MQKDLLTQVKLEHESTVEPLISDDVGTGLQTDIRGARKPLSQVVKTYIKKLISQLSYDIQYPDLYEFKIIAVSLYKRRCIIPGLCKLNCS